MSSIFKIETPGMFHLLYAMKNINFVKAQIEWDYDSILSNLSSLFVLQFDFEGTTVSLQGQMMHMRNPESEDLMYFLCTVNVRVCSFLLISRYTLIKLERGRG